MKKHIKGNHYTRNLKSEWPEIICFLLLIAAILVSVSVIDGFDPVAIAVALGFVLLIAAVGGIAMYLLSREGMWIDGGEVWCRRLRKKRIDPREVEAIVVTRSVMAMKNQVLPGWREIDLKDESGNQLYTMFFMKEYMPWCMRAWQEDGRLISDLRFGFHEYAFCRTVYDSEVIAYFRMRNPELVVLGEFG